ncbi:hypothetical protein P8X24_07180 [Pyrococcus kukulkanii]|uniref:hypothetical protein n=1 Tax=Pyrococcus kukulkanii TaxID=1609559 RepID=UPI003569CFBA
MGNMIALLYYGAIGVGRVSIKAERVIGRAYHEVKALKKDAKYLDKEIKEEERDVKKIRKEISSLKKEFEDKLRDLEGDIKEGLNKLIYIKSNYLGCPALLKSLGI